MDRRRLTPREAFVMDLAIAVLTGAFGVWRELRQSPDLDRLIPLPIGVVVAVQVVAALLLLRRRQQPLTVGAVVAGLCLLTPVQPPAVIAYSVAAHARDRRRSVAVLVLIVAGWCVGAQIWQLDDPVTGPAVIGFAVVLGLYVRARRGLYDALVERAERAEREKGLLAERSAADERSRLAGEMHDVLSHRLTVMLLQAGALATTSTDPAVRESVEELRRNGTAALTELREVFGTIATGESPALSDDSGRTDGSPTDPPALTELVDEWRRTGTVIDVVAAPAPPLPPAIGRTVYRVVQEALTNVAKHAPGADVSMAVDYPDAAVVVTVTNGPRADRHDDIVRNSGTGTGLAGLQQRIELLNGTLEAGDHAGGFRLRASLPLNPGVGRR